MLDPATDYGKRTLDFVTALHAATLRDEVRRLVVAAPGVGGDLLDAIDLNTRPADYSEHYVRDGLLWRDPVILAMHRTLTTLTWTEVLERFSWSKAERALVAEGRDFGANDGFTIPIFSNGVCLGLFSACGWNPDLSPAARSALQVVGLSAHQAQMRAGAGEERRSARHVPLSAREREVVRWVARGKSNEDIGDILGIACATVKTTLARAQLKLNATGRTSAGVQALRLGEIGLT